MGLLIPLKRFLLSLGYLHIGKSTVEMWWAQVQRVARLLLIWSDESKLQNEELEALTQVCQFTVSRTNWVSFVVRAVVVNPRGRVQWGNHGSTDLVLGNENCVLRVRMISSPLLRLYIPRLGDWHKTLGPPSQPIRNNSKINRPHSFSRSS